jgi:quinol monooxygenase YgiN
MSISLLVSGVGAVVAAIGVGLLMARCLRAPRGDLIAWLVALIGLLVALGAQALGHLLGFGGVSFRAMEIGAQVIAPLALVMGLAEVAGTSLPARFASRLFVPSLGFVALVILGTDPLSGVAFSKAWPAPETYYQLIPNKLLEYGLGPASLIVALVTAGFAAARWNRSRAWHEVFLPVVAATVATVLLVILAVGPVLGSHLGLSLPLGSLFAPLCLLAAALTWYAGVSGERVPMTALHGDGAGGRSASRDGRRDGRRDARYGSHDDRYSRHDDARQDDVDLDSWGGGGPWQGADRADTYAAIDDNRVGYEAIDDNSRGVYRGAGLYRDEPPRHSDQAAEARRDDTGYGWQDGSEAYPRRGYAEDYAENGYPATGYAAPEHAAPAYADPAYADPAYAAPEYPPTGYAANGTADPYSAAADPYSGDRHSANGDPYSGRSGRSGQRSATREELFGQIAIYTLIEDRVRDFDRLAEQVVAQVRSGEPDTLVFIVHAVPSAPMQRILYEVYRDRAAYDWHRRQPHVVAFEADRQPYVLATNVIELGLQQAKVSPFPSIADLFGEPGYDTSGFERPDYTREYGRSAGQDGAAL